MIHVENHTILKSYQHAFLKHHSCETQLANKVEEMLRYLDQVVGGWIDILVLDFKKALT